MAKAGRKKEKKIVPKGIVNIHSTFNNTIITICDLNGNVVSWASGGTESFKNSRKSTPFAAQLAAESAAKKAISSGMSEVDVHVKGPGSGREGAIRSVASAGLKVNYIKDITPIPHNGCRPSKRRRP